MKKGFTLFNDSLGVLNELTDEQAGRLFKAIRDFQRGKEPELDALLRIAFAPFKNQFLRAGLGLTSQEISEINTKNRKLRKSTKRNESNEINESVHYSNSISNSNLISNSKFSFADFWNLYAKKTGAHNCERKWNLLSESDKQAIMDKLPLYVQATPDLKYRKNPLTWLNGKGWKDDILPDKEKKQSALEKLMNEPD